MKEREEMNKRIKNGEFGSPPDYELINEEWQKIMDKEVASRGRKTIYNSVCGLWNDKGKVIFSGKTQDSVTIPDGVRVLVLRGDPEEGSRQPDARIVYLTYEN